MENKNSPGVLNLIFQHENVEGVVKLSNWSSDICSLCCYSNRILWNFRWQERIHSWRPSCKHEHWNCASNLFFTSRDKSPCTSLHWDSTCGTLIRWVKNSFITHLQWIEHETWIAKNVFLCPRQIPGIKWHASVAAQHRSWTWNDYRLTGRISHYLNFPLQFDSISWKIRSNHSYNSSFIVKLLLAFPELSSIVWFHGCVWYEYFEVFSLSEPILLLIWPALFEILHIRNGHPPIPIAENELVVEVL